MNELDKVLEKYGLKYSDLTKNEKEVYNSWMETLKKGAITVNTIKENISRMKYAVEEELTKTETNSKQDTFLKARLRNYMLLEAFLSSPEKAKQALERAMSGMVRKV